MRAEQETDLMTASTGSHTRVDDADQSEHRNRVVIRVLAVATFVVILNETIMINAIPLLSFIAATVQVVAQPNHVRLVGGSAHSPVLERFSSHFRTPGSASTSCPGSPRSSGRLRV
jgi:hypothetical protein